LNLSSDEDRRSSSPFPDNTHTDERNATKPHCILLIEDSKADALLVEEALKENDVVAELRVIRDGEQAINFVEAIERGFEPCPDLVVLDLNLPRKSGHDVLRRMRETETCKNVPVVILSSSAIAGETEESKRLGVLHHIQKPATLGEFMRIGSVLKELLGGPITQQ
jgi:CheY-like chemotaxis protein